MNTFIDVDVVINDSFIIKQVSVAVNDSTITISGGSSSLKYSFFDTDIRSFMNFINPIMLQKFSIEIESNDQHQNGTKFVASFEKLNSENETLNQDDLDIDNMANFIPYRVSSQNIVFRI